MCPGFCDLHGPRFCFFAPDKKREHFLSEKSLEVKLATVTSYVRKSRIKSSFMDNGFCCTCDLVKSTQWFSH